MKADTLMRTGLGALLFIMTGIAGPCIAQDLQSGTWSVGGAATAEYTNRDSEQSGISNTYRLDLSLGRVFAKNIEIGIGLDGSHTSRGTGIEYSYGIVPYGTVHIPMTQVSGFYLSAGVGYERVTTNAKGGSTYYSDAMVAYGEGGWQYFFTPNIALNLGLRYAYRDITGGGSTTNDTINTISIPLRMKIYF